MLAFTLVVGPTGTPEAQNAASQPVPQARANENNVDRLSNSIPRDTTKTDDVDSKDTTDAEIDLPDSALESYNAGVQALASGAFDKAAKLFVHARAPRQAMTGMCAIKRPLIVRGCPLSGLRNYAMMKTFKVPWTRYRWQRSGFPTP